MKSGAAIFALISLAIIGTMSTFFYVEKDKVDKLKITYSIDIKTAVSTGEIPVTFSIYNPFDVSIVLGIVSGSINLSDGTSIPFTGNVPVTLKPNTYTQYTVNIKKPESISLPDIASVLGKNVSINIDIPLKIFGIFKVNITKKING